MPDPLRIAVWAVSGLLAGVGLFFGLYTGTPWVSKEAGVRIQRDLDRLERVDDVSLAERQALRAELQRLHYELEWVKGELERLKTYVYPQPSTRRGIGPH